MHQLREHHHSESELLVNEFNSINLEWLHKSSIFKRSLRSPYIHLNIYDDGSSSTPSVLPQNMYNILIFGACTSSSGRHLLEQAVSASGEEQVCLADLRKPEDSFFSPKLLSLAKRVKFIKLENTSLEEINKAFQGKSWDLVFNFFSELFLGQSEKVLSSSFLTTSCFLPSITNKMSFRFL